MPSSHRMKFAIVVAVCSLFAKASMTFSWAALPESHFYLVGIGPGDADLITLRAIEAIKRADLVFCSDGIKKKLDADLAGKQVVTGYWRLFEYYGQDISVLNREERARAEALAKTRNEFIARVRDAVAANKTVAILDAGDPLVYGPWAWCLEEFADLKPVVVPGISAFNAANAALRRGVTDAPKTKSVILTANDWPGKIDTVGKLAAMQTTMVIFTMRAEFDYFIRQLRTHYPPQTPIAIVKFAGYQDREAVVQATLGTIYDKVNPQTLPFEYLIYVGDFLTFRRKAPSSAESGQELPQSQRQ